jgi:predicted metal-dependent peptidase
MTKPKINPALMAKVKARFEDWLIPFMIISFNFVHRLLGIMDKIASEHAETMGVRVLPDGRLQLFYNPTWVDTLSDSSLTYIMYHEVAHVVLHHCTLRKFPDNDLGNIATDLAVNEIVPVVEGSCEPPKDKNGNLTGMFVSEFKKNPLYKDMEESQCAEYYYDYLRKRSFKIPSSGMARLDDHSGWDENELADMKVRAKIAEIDQCDLWGDVGGVEKELIKAAQTRRINWIQYLKMWFGSQLTSLKTTTRKRPHKKYGYDYPGYKRARYDKWLVVFDTSGSVWCENLLGQFLDVLNQIHRDGFPLDYMQCDAEVTDGPHPWERNRISLDFKGCGGTNFQPIMDVVDKQGYKGVVILTDGEAAAPTKPKQARVVWCLPVGKTRPVGVDWGDVVHIQPYTR